MARPERNEVDYFPHFVNHGKKMFYLRSKFKNDGYAVWFILLEQLGKTNHHFLDLSDKIQLMFLSSECMVSEFTLTEIINLLVDFEEFDKALWDDEKILFSQKFNDNILDAYKKRNNSCVDVNSLREILTAKGRLKPSKNTPKPRKSNSEVPVKPHRIEEDSIEEDSIEEKKITKPNKPLPFSLYSALIEEGAEQQLVSDWLAVRKTRKLTNTRTAFTGFMKEVEKGKGTLNQVLTKCVEQSWGGYKNEWVKKTDTPSPTRRRIIS
jgi:hypothetical protein